MCEWFVCVKNGLDTALCVGMVWIYLYIYKPFVCVGPSFGCVNHGLYVWDWFGCVKTHGLYV